MEGGVPVVIVTHQLDLVSQLCSRAVLLELQGAGLLEIEGQDGSWRAVTVLDRATQRDFFVTPRGGDPWGVASALA